MAKTDTRVMTTHEDERDQLTQEALANVDSGQVIDHQTVLAWVDSLDSGQL